MPFDTMVVNTETVFTTDHDFVSIGRQIKPGFVDLFEKAVDFYIEGDWLNAQQNLTMAAQLNFTDQPVRFLQEYLERSKNLPPEDWQNARDIDEQ